MDDSNISKYQLTMEQHILEHTDYYRKLVSKWQPSKSDVPKKGIAGVDAKSNPDMIVCARVRPLLDSEEESGVPPGIFGRGEKHPGLFDIHELKMAIKTKFPSLKVSQSFFF